MVFNFKITDTLFEHYVKKYGIPKCYQAMKRAVDCFKDVDESDRFIFVAGDDRRAIEAVLQRTVDDAASLRKHIERLNKVEIGGAQVEFSVDELERIDQQAKFHGKTRKELVEWMATDMKKQMLEQV